MGTITVNKCDSCGKLFEDELKYRKHTEMHDLLDGIDSDYPTVPKDSTCDFSNGKYCYQRDKQWLDGYKKTVEWAVSVISPNNYHPWSYGWFRSLDDGQSPLYGHAMRQQQICKKCYREWGQPAYANNCTCSMEPKG